MAGTLMQGARNREREQWDHFCFPQCYHQAFPSQPHAAQQQHQAPQQARQQQQQQQPRTQQHKRKQSRNASRDGDSHTATDPSVAIPFTSEHARLAIRTQAAVIFDQIPVPTQAGLKAASLEAYCKSMCIAYSGTRLQKATRVTTHMNAKGWRQYWHGMVEQQAAAGPKLPDDYLQNARAAHHIA